MALSIIYSLLWCKLCDSESMNKSFPLLCPKGLLMGFVSGRCVVIGVILHMATASFLLSICSAKDPPALYIFGDSLVDAGNNFYVNTAAKANFPNGIDFGNPIGIPSGRFTNGRIVTDILGKYYCCFFPLVISCTFPLFNLFCFGRRRSRVD